MVRHDTTGTLLVEIDGLVGRGRALLDRLRGTSEEPCFADWQAEKREWTRESALLLARQFEPAVGQEFIRVNLTLGEDWQLRRDAEMVATRNAVEYLRSLGGTLRV
jgi:hypothetical protein